MPYVDEKQLPREHRLLTAMVGEHVLGPYAGDRGDLVIKCSLAQIPEAYYCWVPGRISSKDYVLNRIPDDCSLIAHTENPVSFDIFGGIVGGPEIRYGVLSSDPADTSGSNFAANIPRIKSVEAARRKLRLLRNQISELKSLPDDWDGYGGLPLTDSAGQRAYEVLRKIGMLAMRNKIEPLLGPLPDGGLDIEWISPKGHELLVEIPPADGPINFVLSRKLETGNFEDTNGIFDNQEQIEETFGRLA